MYYYTYAYLREDRTPYYVGKGKGRRVYTKGKVEIKPPKDKTRIIFLKQNLTEEEAFKHEIYMIAVFGRKDIGTGILRNKTNGGDGISGFRHSEKSKNKMSKKRKGENNAFYGKKHSPETIKRLSENKKGMVSVFLGKNHSQETKDKISNLKKGKYVGDKNPMFGKTHSQEARDKISEANIGKTCPEERKQKISSFHNKLLRLLSPSGEIVEEITTIRKFCKKYNLDRKEISKVIKGELHQFKGWSVPI